MSERIAIVSDAYYPQVSGVARVIGERKKVLEKRGFEVRVIAPRDFPRHVPMPFYPEIKLTLFAYRKLAHELDAFAPQRLHIEVEGPLGFAARKYAKRRGLKFTTSYHTRMPEYVRAYTGIPEFWTYSFLRRFHADSSAVFVMTRSLQSELVAHGFKRVALVPCGVDTMLFNPHMPLALEGTRPIFLYMGRVAIEKNLDAFLSLDLPGTKYVVGDGPARASLEARYPDAIFTGYVFGERLASYLAAADVFVFPSTTDTLGLVMLEANACGTPVAALTSDAARAVIREGENGSVSDDLQDACTRALTLSRDRCRAIAETYSWEYSVDRFLAATVTTAGV